MKLAVRWMHQIVELTYCCHVAYSFPTHDVDREAFPSLFLFAPLSCNLWQQIVWSGILLPGSCDSEALFQFLLLLWHITYVLLFTSFHLVDFNHEFCYSISVINKNQAAKEVTIKEQATVHYYNLLDSERKVCHLQGPHPKST